LYVPPRKPVTFRVGTSTVRRSTAMAVEKYSQWPAWDRKRKSSSGRSAPPLSSLRV
jgi:hypothetical protein